MVASRVGRRAAQWAAGTVVERVDWMDGRLVGLLEK